MKRLTSQHVVILLAANFFYSVSLFSQTTGNYSTQFLVYEPLEIITLSGKLIKILPEISSNREIDLSSLSRGIYMIRISNDEHVWIERLIKQ